MTDTTTNPEAAMTPTEVLADQINAVIVDEPEAVLTALDVDGYDGCAGRYVSTGDGVLVECWGLYVPGNGYTDPYEVEYQFGPTELAPLFDGYLA